MNRYNRRYGNDKLSGIKFWVIFVGIVGYGVWKVVEFRKKLNATHKMQTQEPRKERSPYELPVDSVIK